MAAIVLDRSAVLAAIRAEPGGEELLARIAAATGIAIGAPTAAASACALTRRYGSAGRGLLSRFLEENEVISIPFDGRHWSAAADAFLRFGEGRHPANLSDGDCMAYATARVAGLPLLFTGEAFARTDLEAA